MHVTKIILNDKYTKGFLISCLVFFAIFVIVLFSCQTSYSLQNICPIESISETKHPSPAGKSVTPIKFPNMAADNASTKQNFELHAEPEPESTEPTKVNEENLSSPIFGRNLSSQLISPSVKAHWNGMNIFSAADCIKKRPVNPPDVTIGVSKKYVAQMVHENIQVWDKRGNPIVKESLYDFFNVSRTNYLTDPEIVYDNVNGAWFATIVDGGESKTLENGYTSWSCEPVEQGCKIILVKSSNDNPIQNRTVLRIDARFHDFFPDQPKIAVSKTSLLVTTSQFNITKPEDTFSFVYLIDKDFRQIFDGKSWDIKPWGSDQHFAIQERNPSGCLYSTALVKENRLDKYSNVSAVKIVDYCDKRDIGTYFGPYAVPLGREFKLVPAPKFKQPLSEILLNETDLTVSSAMRNGSSIWIALHAACQPALISNLSCIRALKFDRVPAQDNYVLAESRQYHINDTDVYFPAIGISTDGKLFLISGFSNKYSFPSIAASQLVSGNKSIDLIRVFGSYINNSTRYGDYFGSAIDPVDGSVWLSGEYVDGSISIPIPSDFEGLSHMRELTWSTYIANIS